MKKQIPIIFSIGLLLLSTALYAEDQCNPAQDSWSGMIYTKTAPLGGMVHANFSRPGTVKLKIIFNNQYPVYHYLSGIISTYSPFRQDHLFSTKIEGTLYNHTRWFSHLTLHLNWVLHGAWHCISKNTITVSGYLTDHTLPVFSDNFFMDLTKDSRPPA